MRKPGNSFSPTFSLSFPLPRQFRMRVPLPASFFREFGKSPYRHQKVLVSNLGLTVFVKHQINWLNRFLSLPSGKEKKKQLKGKNLRSPFLPLTRAKASKCSLSLLS
jgi:hypothetical protein